MLANTLLKFSRVNPPLVVEVTDGVNARNSTTATGTRATIVMNRMSTKRHHCPRVPFSRGGQLLLVFLGDVTDLGGLVDDGHQIAAFRICR